MNWFRPRRVTPSKLDLVLQASVTARADAEMMGRLYGELVAVRQELATAKASLDWLSQLVTQLQTERALFLERLIELRIPTPRVSASWPEREDDRSARVGMAPPVSETPGDAFQSLAAVFGASFDDMGDEAAAHAGVAQDPVTGAVMYTK